jgi:hypothetical protein
MGTSHKGGMLVGYARVSTGGRTSISRRKCREAV